MARETRWDDWSGKALTVQVLIQAILGVWLSTRYSASLEGAYASVSNMPSFLRGLHFWGSGLLICHTLIHVLVSAFTGAYTTDRLRYLSSVLLLPALLVVQTTGNLLPQDRHGVQTAVIEAGIARQVPVAGNLAATTMLGSSNGYTEATLRLWYTAHWVAGILILILALAIGQKGRYLRPSVLAPLAIAVLLGALVPAPLGSPATSADTNAYNALPGWYVLPMHAFLVATSRYLNLGWIGVTVIPALFFLALLVLPWVRKTAWTPALRGGVLAIVLSAAGLVLGLGLKSAPVVGKRDPKETTSLPRLVLNDGQDAKLAAQGRELFQREGCVGCHGRDGLVAEFGPSLADVHKEQPGAAFYMKFVRDPASVNPKSDMPAFPQLKEEELRALAEFLRFPRRYDAPTQ
jgi:mono/diheme cytochrome c family protein